MNSAFGFLGAAILVLLVAGYIGQSHLPPPTPKIIGIDLGTTFSCVGAYHAVSGKVQIFENEDKKKVIPSIVAFTEDGIVVGCKASDQAETNSDSTIYDAKRFIGKKFTKHDLEKFASLYQFKIVPDETGNPKFVVGKPGNQSLVSPEEIGSFIIKELKTTAERNLSAVIKQAVMSVPAEFNMEQRNTTIKAAKLAGIEVLRVINEPTAAALAYGLHKKDGISNVMVVDLGGGTLDVSLLNIQGGMFVTMAMAGNNRLGGQDFSNRLMSYLLSVIKERYGKELEDAQCKQRLRQEVEAAKINLTDFHEVVVKVALPSLKHSRSVPIFEEKITRDTFEKINTDLFTKVLKPIERVLEEVELPKEYVDEIVLVGGSTRIPNVRRIISEYFNGIELNVSIDPELAVAMGVSIQAGIIGGAWPLQVSAIEILRQDLRKIHIND